MTGRPRRLRISFPAHSHCAAVCLALLLCAGVPLPAGGAETVDKFPASTVTIVVPFVPGGTSDFAARTLGQALAAAWKVPVVVDNKPGASGKLAADAVARAPADGYTLLIGAVSVVTHPPLYRSSPYVPQLLTPLGVGVASQLVTIARQSVPAKDVPGLIALSVSHPAGLSGASPGTGTLSHLGLEMLVLSHQARISHVPYRGSAPALTDVMGGQVDVMIDAITSAAPAIASGKVKAIAVHTPQRVPMLPGVPTYEEQGFKGMTFGAWNILMVPSRTPPDRIATLHVALARAIKDPAVIKALADRGLDPIVQPPAESIEFMLREAQRWEKVIRDANVTP